MPQGKNVGLCAWSFLGYLC